MVEKQVRASLRRLIKASRFDRADYSQWAVWIAPRLDRFMRKLKLKGLHTDYLFSNGRDCDGLAITDVAGNTVEVPDPDDLDQFLQFFVDLQHTAVSKHVMASFLPKK